MFSKRYIGYALFAVLIICWLWNIESRNEQFPRIEEIKVEEVEGESQVNLQINNPGNQPVRVAAHIRLQASDQDGAKREFAASPVVVLTHEIEPLSQLSIEHSITNWGDWQEADVQLYVLDDAAILQKSHLDRLGRLSANRLQEFFE